MAQEHQANPSSELQAKQARLNHVIEQRDILLPKIGTGKIREDVPGIQNIFDSVKVGRVRERLTESKFRASEHLSQVNSEIEIIQKQDTAKLIEMAKRHEAEVLTYRRALAELRRLGLPQEVISRRESEYSDFRDKPNSDPDLKRGIKLLEEQRRKEKEGQQPQETEKKIELSKPDSQLEIRHDTLEEIVLPDGQSISLVGKNLLALKCLLLFSEENPAQISDLTKRVYGEDSRANRERLSSIISGLSRLKLVSIGWRILNPISLSDQRKGIEAKYYLQQIQRQALPDEEEKTSQGEESGWEQVEEMLIAGTISTQGEDEDEPTYMPFMETEEERQEEEKKILGVMVAYLKGHDSLFYTEIIRQLSEQFPQRVQRHLGGLFFKMPTSRVLIAKANVALKRLSDESKESVVREHWTQLEKDIWANVESVKRQWKAETDSAFKDKLRGKIIKARNDYLAFNHLDREEDWIKI